MALLKKYTLYLLCTIILGMWFGVSCYDEGPFEQATSDVCQIEDDISFDVLNHVFTIDIDVFCETTTPTTVSQDVVYPCEACHRLSTGVILAVPLRGPPAIG